MGITKASLKRLERKAKGYIKGREGIIVITGEDSDTINKEEIQGRDVIFLPKEIVAKYGLATTPTPLASSIG